MFIKKIRIKNWMAFRGKTVLEGLGQGPIAIVAQYADNARRSNWAGKTALLEAIRFAITGLHRKRLEDSVITYGEAETSVEVEFSTGLTISRVRPRGGPTVLRVFNANGVHERDAAEQVLLRELRLGADDLDNTNWISQGDTEALVGQTSGARRAVVSRWLELDRWERLGATAAKYAREAATDLEIVRRTDLEPEPRSEEEIVHDIEAANEELEVCARQIVEIDEELAAAASFSDIAPIRAKHEANVEAYRQSRDAVAALAKLTDEEVAAAVSAASDAAAKLRACEEDRARVQGLLIGDFDGECPVTCKACPVASDISKERDAFVERLDVIADRLGELREKSREAGALVREHQKLAAERTRGVSRLNVALAHARASKEALEAAETEAEEKGEAPSPERLRGLKERREEAKARERVASQSIGGLEEQLKRRAAYKERLAAREEALTKKARAARVAALAARALGPAGIPARIAAESLRGLEERANSLLAGTGLSFELAWERELKDPSPVCFECGHVYERKKREKECPSCSAPRGRKRSDELDILVNDGSEEIEDARMKSGGAKVMIACAIRLAGGMMLREKRGATLDVAFVDEPFGPLDAENREVLARTFASLLSSVGLEQAFVVSHDAALLDALPNRILITRDGNASRARLDS